MCASVCRLVDRYALCASFSLLFSISTRSHSLARLLCVDLTCALHKPINAHSMQISYFTSMGMRFSLSAEISVFYAECFEYNLRVFLFWIVYFLACVAVWPQFIVPLLHRRQYLMMLKLKWLHMHGVPNALIFFFHFVLICTNAPNGRLNNRKTLMKLMKSAECIDQRSPNECKMLDDNKKKGKHHKFVYYPVDSPRHVLSSRRMIASFSLNSNDRFQIETRMKKIIDFCLRAHLFPRKR